MRLTCAQTGVCEACGVKIYRHKPTQAWMAWDTANENCYPTLKPHKPAPWKEQK